MADIIDREAAQTVKVTGADSTGAETNVVGASENQEIFIRDTHDNGGLDTVLSLAAGVPTELKVGTSRKLLRKYVIIEALDTNIKWGFSSVTQSFDIFKSQVVMIPVGENTEIWLKYDSGSGTADIAIAELS